MILIIILVNFIFYFRTLFYDFVCDDFVIAHRPAQYPKPKNVFIAIWRELNNLEFYNHKRVHFFTILLHTITACLVYWLFGANQLSFLTALLFSLNPSLTECSIWISGRFYVYATILTLLMFIWPWGSVLLWLASVNLSIISFSAPVIFFFNKTGLWPYGFLPVLGIPFLRVFQAKLKHNKEASTTEGLRISWKKFIPVIKTYGYYFILCLIPWRLGFYHSVGQGAGLTEKYNQEFYALDKDFWLGLLVLAAVSAGFIFTSFWFGLAWFTITILPFCNIITISQTTSFRYSYLATIGLMLFLANLLLHLGFGMWPGYIVLMGYAVRLWFYMPAYRSEFWFNEYQIYEQPKNPRGWHYRGNKKFKTGDLTGALADFIESVELKSHDCKDNYNVAQLYLTTGDIEVAQVHLDIARQNIYQNEECGKMLGLITDCQKLIDEGKRAGRFKMEKLYIMK